MLSSSRFLSDPLDRKVSCIGQGITKARRAQGPLKVVHLTSRASAFHYSLISPGLCASILLASGRRKGLCRTIAVLDTCVPGGSWGIFESRSEWTRHELMFLKCFELLSQHKLFNPGAWLVSLEGPCNGKHALSALAPG